ncbi:MAG: aspartate aminotransferase family protein [Williamsia sp.]|nr:aspartate aminotransferase family protein [Williamsia sp.]
MDLINQFARLAVNYINTRNDQPVFPGGEAIQRLDEFAAPLQAEPLDPGSVLAMLDRIGSPATVKSAAGRYYGFVTGGSLPAALSAKLLASVWDQNSALSVMSPVAAKLETVAAQWIISAVGLPQDCGYGFVTGDTMANFTALAAARHQLLKQLGWNVEAQGLFGAPEIDVIVGNEVHVSVLKALSMLGFGKDRLIRVPVDKQGSMLPDKIPPITTPTIVCTQAGNVNTGAFDPVKEICTRLHASPCWVHVDAAFGLWAAASPAKKYLAQGMELAHSWATDAHKWLNVPYDCGLVFVRDKEALYKAMTSSAAYLPTDGIREPMHYVPEMSRQARAIPVWAALKSLGTKGLAELIEKNCGQARYLAEHLRAAGFTILNDVVLNQVLVSFGDPELTRQVITRVQQEGVCWCGGTVWQEKTAMRISVSCWATTQEDLDRSLVSIIKHANSVKHSQNE